MLNNIHAFDFIQNVLLLFIFSQLILTLYLNSICFFLLLGSFDMSQLILWSYAVLFCMMTSFIGVCGISWLIVPMICVALSDLAKCSFTYQNRICNFLLINDSDTLNILFGLCKVLRYNYPRIIWMSSASEVICGWLLRRLPIVSWCISWNLVWLLYLQMALLLLFLKMRWLFKLTSVAFGSCVVSSTCALGFLNNVNHLLTCFMICLKYYLQCFCFLNEI